MRTILIEAFASLLGTLGFSMMFRVGRRYLPITALGGLLTYLVYAMAGFLTSDQFVRNFAGALFAALFAYFLAVYCRIPATVFHSSFLIPLVPGGLLYYTMLALIEGDLSSFLSYGGATVRIGLGIAAGIVTGGTAIRVNRAIHAGIAKRNRT